LVVGNPQRPLSTSEQQKLVDFVLDGGHLVVSASAGGLLASNFNEVLELFGITLRQDAVIRCAMHKYYHPKQVYVSDGIVNRAITNAAREEASRGVDLPRFAKINFPVH
jgi:intraflagellar transport protein 52